MTTCCRSGMRAATCRWCSRRARCARPRGRRLFFVLVSRLRPVTLVLLEEGERLERAHAIEEQHAVEVIGFVLNNPRGKTRRAEFDGTAVSIETFHRDLPRARHLTADVRN